MRPAKTRPASTDIACHGHRQRCVRGWAIPQTPAVTLCPCIRLFASCRGRAGRPESARLCVLCIEP